MIMSSPPPGESNHRDRDHDAITTTLTNPGIIDRLEQDIADYLSPFGFRIERQKLEDGDGAGAVSGSGGNSSSRAVLTIPSRPCRYTTGNATPSMGHNVDLDVNDKDEAVGPTIPATVQIMPLIIMGTLHLHIHQESLLSTAGPLLRTFLRLSPHHTSPQQYRAVIHCESSSQSQYNGLFTLDALQKFDKMNSQQRRNQLKKNQESLSAKRMAHHVHMLVRNSMGSALCLDLVVILPFYLRRNEIQQDQDDDGNNVDDATATTTNTTTGSSSKVVKVKVPLSAESVSLAMRDNPDACYPSVQLVEQKGGPNYCVNHEGGELLPRDDNNSNNNKHNNGISGPRSLHLHVHTRMCTVRHQPLLFRWLYGLQEQDLVKNDDHNFENDAQYEEGAAATNNQLLCAMKNHPNEPPKSGTFSKTTVPLIVACIEKVANLHRILMLCHDYDKINCSKEGEEDDASSEDDDSDNHQYSSAEPSTTSSSLLSNVIVVLPNNNGDDDDANKKVFKKKSKGKEQNNGAFVKGKMIREFENAIDHFHEVIIKPERRRRSSNDGCDDDYEHLHRYRPTLVYEEDAPEKIRTIIQQRQSYHSSTQPSSSKPPTCELSMVGIDLHPDALTLYGDYATPNKKVSAALRTMRNANAIVFGYESTGIPDSIGDELNGWVQIPSRSSINVVAAMSIVLDALVGAGAECE